MPETANKDEVLERIRTDIGKLPELHSGFYLQDMTLDDDATLTIIGEVPSVAAKKRALETAAAHEAVEAIVDRLHVRPAAEMSDAGILSRLRRAFTQEPSFEGYAIREMQGERDPNMPVFGVVAGDPDTARHRIDIEVRDGVVILNGLVPGLVSKRLAGVLAWWVAGVRDVVNGLEAEEEDAPIRIEEAVRVVLERDPYIDASQIRVGVRNRVVRLTGSVGSESLRDMAERDAWYVFGVDDVINEIEIQP